MYSANTFKHDQSGLVIEVTPLCFKRRNPKSFDMLTPIVRRVVEDLGGQMQKS